MPVMEGKAMLFKEFANVDAFPICINESDPSKIIDLCVALKPTFGGINLEDIKAPECFEIERELQKRVDIPIFHDDQHGTAIVLGAAFINALRVTGKKASELKVVMAGVGASGTACANMLMELGVENLIGCDRKGALSSTRTEGMNKEKWAFQQRSNPNDESGDLSDVIAGADMFVGLSGPDILTEADIQKMNKDPLIFPMSNPTPEIPFKIAVKYASVIGTGRSDYPNQINNVLAFPGVFRGALDAKAPAITRKMIQAAAHAIADCIDPESLGPEYVIPSAFNPDVAPAVARAVAQAWKDDPVLRLE
eukprot:NODE_900_length_1125_cov_97.155311_g858_i0.p1 GENE.NODE_900_length_1125_cov_97.155311_g858_i0~~NODE_900_length_1125_cov_97.155311_g858_i0.p1  ORF type:complete len:336 (-),score=80.77 NODE_900_length_1125_cov_97.155311_g858_i0:117-1040(-)